MTDDNDFDWTAELKGYDCKEPDMVMRHPNAAQELKDAKAKIQACFGEVGERETLLKLRERNNARMRFHYDEKEILQRINSAIYLRINAMDVLLNSITKINMMDDVLSPTFGVPEDKE